MDAPEASFLTSRTPARQSWTAVMIDSIERNKSLNTMHKLSSLRKKNYRKAHKRELLLKKKLGKHSKEKQDSGKSKLLRVSTLGEKSNGLLDSCESVDDVEVDFVPRAFEQELSELCGSDSPSEGSRIFLEMKEAIDRFLSVNDRRAAGKDGGGGMEDFGLEEGEDEEDSFRDEQAARLGLEGTPAGDDEEEDDENGNHNHKANRLGLSRKKLKQMRRPTVSQLKQACARPEVVESWDTTAPDPKFLVFLKAHRNTVPVPPHWSHKRRYLQGKRGLEKSHFNLPHYIEATKISEIRKAIEDKDSKKTLKQRMREKARPRHRKMNIDYQTLHDAFFKYATKPPLTKFGDVYFEGKETEMMFRRYTPGKLSARCRDALGMTGILDAPPWLVNMQRYGPPPSYPNLVVPGVNAHLPEGAALGFQPGGWGKPPGLDQLKVWGVTPRFEEVVLGEDQLEGLDSGYGGYWGALQMIDSEDDMAGNEEGLHEPQEGEGKPSRPPLVHQTIGFSEAMGFDPNDSTQLTTSGQVTPVTFDPSGIASITSFSTGFMTPGLQGSVSGIQSVSTPLNTPQGIDLRRSGFSSDASCKPYTILEQTKAPPQSGTLFASAAVYTVPSSSSASNTENF